MPGTEDDLIGELADRLGDEPMSLSREDAAELLGITSQAVSNRIRQGRLVAIREGRRRLLPVWQFDPGFGRSRAARQR